MTNLLPRYPIYIPSKGRYENQKTANFLLKDGVPFKLVVEPTEYDAYAARFGESNLLVLPFHDLGQGSIPARNWIKQHAMSEGHERHWQFDDNIGHIGRRWKGKRIRCNAGVALRAVEDFTDRYENVAISGLNYLKFLLDWGKYPPFFLNHRVYSCALILNALPNEWRGRYNEDADLCLQVLGSGWCTVLVNAFFVEKITTLKMRGGNMTTLYQGDGRLKMARSLERLWPGVVETKRRYKRPQHMVKDEWRRFDTPLKLKPGIDLEAMQPNEYGMTLKQVAGQIKSPELMEIMRDYKSREGR